MKKMFLDYVSPEVEVINVQVERGIAISSERPEIDE